MHQNETKIDQPRTSPATVDTPGTTEPAGNASRAADTAHPANEIESLHAQLREARQRLERSERQHAIDRALHGCGVIDLEVGRTLVEEALTRVPANGTTPSDPSTAITGIVAQLRTRKPYLFRSGGGERRPRPGIAANPITNPFNAAAGGPPPVAPASAPESALAPGTYTAGLESLARQARDSGDRRALLRYLEARRAG